MINPMMLVTVVPTALLVAGYIYAGDWDALMALIQSHIREILCAIEATAIFVTGIFKKYKLGFMILMLLIVTITWRA